MEFWATVEGVRTIRVYGKGGTVSLALADALITLARIHYGNERTQLRIMRSLGPTLPRDYWVRRAALQCKDIVDLTVQGDTL